MQSAVARTLICRAAAPAARAVFTPAARAPGARAVSFAAVRPTTVQFASPMVCRAMSGSGFLDAKEVTARIVEVVSNFEKVDSSKVGPDTKFEALNLDSLDIVEVVLAIEEEFALEIPDAEADKITSVAEAVAFISAHPLAK